MRPRRRGAGKDNADKEEPAQNAAAGSQDGPGLVGRTFKDTLVAQAPRITEVDGDEQDHDVYKAIGIAPLATVELNQLFRHPVGPDPPKLDSIYELAAKSPHLELTDTLASKRAAAARAKGALASLAPDDDIYQKITAELEKQEAEIAKLAKKAPTPAVLTERLKTVHQEQVLKATAQEQVADHGRQKAAERLKLQLDAIDKLSRSLVERRRAIVQAHTEAELAWSVYRTKQKAQWDRQLAALAAEIAKQESGADLTQMVTDHDAADDNPLARAAEDAAMITQLTADTARALQEAAALQVAAAIPVPLEANPLHRHITITEQEVPQVLPELQPQQWHLLHQLWTSLEIIARNETFAGPLPMTLGQLKAGPTLPKLLLGEALWAKAFPEGEPGEDTVIPRQVRGFLWEFMMVHRDKLLQDKTRQEAAQIEVAEQVAKDIQDHRNKRHRAAPPATGGGA